MLGYIAESILTHRFWHNSVDKLWFEHTDPLLENASGKSDPDYVVHQKICNRLHFWSRHYEGRIQKKVNSHFSELSPDIVNLYITMFPLSFYDALHTNLTYLGNYHLPFCSALFYHPYRIMNRKSSNSPIFSYSELSKEDIAFYSHEYYKDDFDVSYFVQHIIDCAQILALDHNRKVKAPF